MVINSHEKTGTNDDQSGVGKQTNKPTYQKVVVSKRNRMCFIFSIDDSIVNVAPKLYPFSTIFVCRIGEYRCTGTKSGQQDSSDTYGRTELYYYDVDACSVWSPLVNVHIFLFNTDNII